METAETAVRAATGGCDGTELFRGTEGFVDGRDSAVKPEDGADPKASPEAEAADGAEAGRETAVWGDGEAAAGRSADNRVALGSEIRGSVSAEASASALAGALLAGLPAGEDAGTVVAERRSAAADPAGAGIVLEEAATGCSGAGRAEEDTAESAAGRASASCLTG